MSATIKDVAELAGVSAATVSYVLNQSAPVSQQTRDRVLQAVAKLDYRPSYRARSLRDRQSRTLGLLLPDGAQAETLLPTPLLAGLTAASSSAGYHLLLASTPAGGELELYRELATTGRVDGVIVLAPGRADARLALLRELQLPHVCLGRPPRGSGGGGAGRNVYAGAQRAVSHLAHQGHQRIALIQQPSEQAEARDWYVGYRRGLRAAGLAYDPELVVEGGPGSDSGYSAMEALLAPAEPPTAIIASAEYLALAALNAASTAGLQVGRELALVASGDSLAIASAQPPLTTMRWPEREIGLALGRLLLNTLAGAGPASYQAFEPQLIVRASSARQSVRG